MKMQLRIQTGIGHSVWFSCISRTSKNHSFFVISPRSSITNPLLFNQKSYKNVNKNSITQIVKLTKKFLFSWKCNGIFSIVNKSIHMNKSTYLVVSLFSNFNSWIFTNLSLSLFRSESFDSKLLWLVQKFVIQNWGYHVVLSSLALDL